MKFNPITSQLFTDKGLLIKKIECPFKVKWNDLEKNKSTNDFRTCNNCDNVVLDTKYLSDLDLLNKIKENENTCFKVNLNQDNLKIIHNDFLEI